MAVQLLLLFAAAGSRLPSDGLMHAHGFGWELFVALVLMAIVVGSSQSVAPQFRNTRPHPPPPPKTMEPQWYVGRLRSWRASLLGHMQTHTCGTFSPHMCTPSPPTICTHANIPIPAVHTATNHRTAVVCRTPQELEGISKACLVGREVLDAAHRAVRPGVTTDEIDRVVSAFWPPWGLSQGN